MPFSPLKSGPDSPGNCHFTPEHSDVSTKSTVILSTKHFDLSPANGTKINFTNKRMSTPLMSSLTLWEMNDEEYTSWLVSEMCTVFLFVCFEEFCCFCFVLLRGVRWIMYNARSLEPKFFTLN